MDSAVENGRKDRGQDQIVVGGFGKGWRVEEEQGTHDGVRRGWKTQKTKVLLCSKGWK